MPILFYKIHFEKVIGIMEVLNKLSNLKIKLDSMRPLNKDTLKSLINDFNLKYTYHSNAIEGNTLTLTETKIVLEGITIGGKTLKEHLEVINHESAIEYMMSIAQKNAKLDERVLKELNGIVLSKIDNENAGKYRNANVIIAGAKHTPPYFLHIKEEMKKFFIWYNENINLLHPVEFASRLHGEFVKIHPFIDGNGRTARLIMNLELIRQGYPLTIIEITDRLNYYNSLDKAHLTGDYDDFIKLVAYCVIRSFERYFSVL